MANMMSLTYFKTFWLCLVLCIHEERHFLTFGQQILAHNFAIRNSVCSNPGAIVEESNLLLTVLVYTFRVDLSLPWTFSTNLSTINGLNTIFATAKNTKCEGMVLVNDINKASDYPVVCSRDGTYLYLYINRVASMGLTDQILTHTFRSMQGETVSTEYIIPIILEAGNETLMVNWETLDTSNPWILFSPDIDHNITYCVGYSGKTHLQIGFQTNILRAKSKCISMIIMPTIDSIGIGLFIRADEERGPCKRSYVRRFILTMELFDVEY